MRSKQACLVLLLAVALGLPVLAEESTEATNVLITFNVGSVEDGEEVVLKTYEMVVNANGEPAEMSTGARVPIPTTSFKVSDDGTRVAAPATSYTYQQIGFTAKLSAQLYGDSIRLRGHVEDSSLAETPMADGRPFIQSMHQNIVVTLPDGEPLRINRVDEAETRSFFIQVRADRLDDGGRRVAAK
jgi:hypothetical protein